MWTTEWNLRMILIRSDRESIVHPGSKAGIPCFNAIFTVNGTITYKVNTMLCWRRLENSNWDCKLVRKLFTMVVNQVRSTVVFSKACVQLELFLKPVGLSPTGYWKECRFKTLGFTFVNLVHQLFWLSMTHSFGNYSFNAVKVSVIQ